MPRLERVRIIIAGSRPPQSAGLHTNLLRHWHEEHYPEVERAAREFETKFQVVINEIVSGHAQGYDTLGERWSLEYLGKPATLFPAQWNLHGRAAGHIRNQQMIAEGKPRGLLAFWDDVSSGTRNMIEIATKAELMVLVKRA